MRWTWSRTLKLIHLRARSCKRGRWNGVGSVERACFCIAKRWQRGGDVLPLSNLEYITTSVSLLHAREMVGEPAIWLRLVLIHRPRAGERRGEVLTGLNQSQTTSIFLLHTTEVWFVQHLLSTICRKGR